jgi:nitrite reductase (NO-forming)
VVQKQEGSSGAEASAGSPGARPVGRRKRGLDAASTGRQVALTAALRTAAGSRHAASTRTRELVAPIPSRRAGARAAAAPTLRYLSILAIAALLIAVGACSQRSSEKEGAAASPAPTPGATIDPNAKPPEGFKPYDPELKPAPGGKEHKITIEATEEVIEVAPGVKQEMWLFNHTYPGPILRGKVGDIFTITLVNKGKIGHSIDFHASKVAWDDEMRTIQPGEQLVYQFEAKHAGIYMYHCGTPPALHHIGNGMFGAIVIDPPNLEPVEKEFVFVQSELYLGPEGKPGDYTKMRNDQWDTIVFNGYYKQYFFKPIEVEVGKRYRAWVLDAGPSENSSFHIVGTIFDTVYKEGEYRLRPGGGSGGAQALDLQPAQGGFVEFSFDEPGQYLIVTHKFSNVDKGAVGVFQAGKPGSPRNEAPVTKLDGSPVSSPSPAGSAGH